MGLLNSALQIGRSAILGYEGALHVVGNNVSSAGSPNYTRLPPDLNPVPGSLISGDLQPGAGVALTAIQRNIDEALEGRVRLSIGTREFTIAQEAALAQVESLFDDFTGTGVGPRMLDFFGAFDDLQNTPEDVATRDLAVTRGVLLAESLRDLRSQLTQLADGIDDQIGELVHNADDIARQIGGLNHEITTAEAGREGQAAALRDQRDGLLRELSELFDVVVREQPNGTINVYVGNEALVQGNSTRGLTTVDVYDGASTRATVRFADTNQEVTLGTGRIAGLVRSRDEHAPIAAVDELAAAVISEVNRAHADGQGLIGFSSVTSSYDVLSADVPLDGDGSGLAVRPRNGSFYITVADDSTQTPVAHRVDVDVDGSDAGMTLSGLVERINTQVEHVSASITSDNRLHIEAEDGFTFTFGHDGQQAREDTSGVLASLGVNTLFTGADARDIAVNPLVREQPNLLAAASVFLPGDGAIAARIASLDSAESDRLNGTSISGFFRSISNNVAVITAAARDDVDAASAVYGALQAQRESISGVNLDEEAISLLKYERAFQGASRFVGVVDGLIDELIALVR